MMSDRVHPVQPEEPVAGATPETPRSSEPRSGNVDPKPGPQPGSYVIHVPKDLVLRTPPEGNARRAKAYARRAARRRRSCCCLLLAWLAALLVLLAAAAGVLYLVFRPRAPDYSIDALSIAPLNLSAAAVSPQFNATVRADNPNKKVGIYYRHGSDITVTYDGVTLCTGAWPAFYHAPRNETVFVAVLTGSDIRLSSANQQSLLAAEAQGQQIPLRIDAKVPVRVKFGAVTSWTITVKVKCDIAVDKLTENAKIVSKNCHVKVKVFKFLVL
ncbi:Late embryogenesis abundant protein [Musa troglodytarum]|uniref:Late embryogenesis abundant protein n=1 Tax=Musa troglodytarum TaxID=320322 RepID=A0A9E7GGG3_9LILI|nr:Late embryogenesis abundant protein [Musa troglodytarum]